MPGKRHRIALQLLPQNTLYIIIGTRNISQIGKSQASVQNPSGSQALHSFKQHSSCKRWGQRAGTAGLLHSWEHSRTRAATSAANSGHRHCAATLSFPSKRWGIFTLEPNDGVSISHLARLLIFRMRQGPSFPRQFQREQPCPQFQGALHLLLHHSRVTFIANVLKKL